MTFFFSCLKLQFIPGTFQFIKEQFGELSIFWPESSLILTKEEVKILSKMIESKDGVLLYRATRDGFEASSFHSKCDGKAKTITIIKTKDNYVFGGYTDASWDSSNSYKAASSAYIYSLRRNGVSNLSKHNISNNDHGKAIFTNPSYGPTFGGGHDLNITNNSNLYKGSHTNPKSYSGIPSNTYLAGTHSGWLTSDIEVYQIL